MRRAQKITSEICGFIPATVCPHTVFVTFLPVAHRCGQTSAVVPNEEPCRPTARPGLKEFGKLYQTSSINPALSCSDNGYSNRFPTDDVVKAERRLPTSYPPVRGRRHG